MYNQTAVITEDVTAIAEILATGYLRYRDRLRRQNSLDAGGMTSVHGHEVNASEKEEPVGNHSTAAA